MPAPRSASSSLVTVRGRQLIVRRRLRSGALEPPKPYAMRAVCWSPTGKGERNREGYRKYYSQYALLDVPKVAALNANTVRTYDPFETNASGRAVMDFLHSKGIMVAMTVLAWHGDAGPKSYLQAVDFFKGHPALLCWIVGNEFNYNQFYGAPSLDRALEIANEAIDGIHARDKDHPVAAGLGEVTRELAARVPRADLFALNLYPWLDMESRFAKWPQISPKPFFVSEYGADAYNQKTGKEDQESQAHAVGVLTRQIQANSSARDPRRVCVGGAVFSLNDEWWKSAGGDERQDTGGFENGGVYPDGQANEEWWGLLDIDRKPRKAYYILRDLYRAAARR